MRLGAYTARLRPGSRVAQAYGVGEISERHRHRWEVSNAYRDVLAEYGLRLSGQSPDGGLVEVIELPEHAWFIGCQFHPELKSRPTRPHPLFAGFVGAALRRRQGRGEKAAAPGRAGRDRDADGAGPSAARRSSSPGPASSSPATCCPESPTHWPGSRRSAAFPSASRPASTRPTARGSHAPRGVRDWTRGSACWSGCASASGLPILTDIHEAAAGRGGGRGGRRAPDPGVPLPPDRSAGGGRPDRSAGQCEEGAVDARRGDGGRASRRCARAAAATSP